MKENQTFDPQRCTKRDIAKLFKTSLAQVDGWVRRGCPSIRTGGIRSPLEFKLQEVLDWYAIECAQKSANPLALLLAEAEAEIRALGGKLAR